MKQCRNSCHVISDLTDLDDPHIGGLRDRLTERPNSIKKRADTPHAQAQPDSGSEDECDLDGARPLSPHSENFSGEDDIPETSGEVDEILKEIGLRKKKPIVKRKTRTAKPVTDPIRFQILAGTKIRGKDSLRKANQLLKAGQMHQQN